MVRPANRVDCSLDPLTGEQLQQHLERVEVLAELMPGFTAPNRPDEVERPPIETTSGR